MSGDKEFLNGKEFLNELLTLHPELHDFYSSEQYQLSEKIIEIMMAKCMTEEQVADLLNIDLDDFVRMTSGDNTVDTSKYKQVINQLQKI